MRNYRYREVLRLVRDDFNACVKTKSRLWRTVAFLTSINFQVLFLYRHCHYWNTRTSRIHQLLLKFVSYYARTRFQCHISESSQIGTNLRLPHPTGIVIGEGVEIGDNVTIFQQVTIGSHGKRGLERSYPIIEDDAVIYAGAKLIGNIRIGRNAVIGANAVVNLDVPAGCVAVGIPAKVIQKREQVLQHG
ncbi:serine acetyltransferase [Cohnella sp. CFH 77786]|uniref:serine O-acetyltransferase n=1 Tax=Cohnella sp. CFH 77786 TaxID=2662265 RepID=UPI001C60CA80|nr:serine O-acetyltransferase [Cohnella sp. CFH 77786]MBW5448388.1 serine acetyltransferase [Cohnella sp. CFH 77786]